MKRKLISSMLVMLCLCGVTACGEQSGVPESGSGNFNTVFTGPTAWDEDEVEESLSDETQDISDEPDESSTVSEPEESSTTVTEPSEEAPLESEEEEQTPDDKTIPDMADLLGLNSVEASELMSGILRGNIIVAWGNPNGEIDRGLYGASDQDGRDKWTVQTTSGEVSIYLRYGYASGQARVIEAYTRYDGWENRLWDDMEPAAFGTWVADTADMVKVLTKMGDMTRHDIIGVLDWPAGCVLTEDEVFVGDVFKIYGTNEATSYFLLVKYDEEQQSYPVGVKFYPLRGENGQRLKAPELEEGLLYSTGKYNQAKFKAEYVTNK